MQLADIAIITAIIGLIGTATLWGIAIYQASIINRLREQLAGTNKKEKEP